MKRLTPLAVLPETKTMVDHPDGLKLSHFDKELARQAHGYTMLSGHVLFYFYEAILKTYM